MLAYDVLTPPGAEPNAYVLFLHGLLGDRTNLRTLARGLIRQRPGLGAVVVDIRMHGESQGLTPPHTINVCASDLVSLAASLDLPVRAMVGHSLGGKVAMAFAGMRSEGLEQVWAIDSMPGSRTVVPGSPPQRDSIVNVIVFLEGLPPVLSSRDELVQRAVAAGFDQALAGWLAKNLRAHVDGQFRLRVDLSVIRALLANHYATDLWQVLEDIHETDFHFVIGGRSQAFSPEDRGRLDGISAVRANVHTHVIEGAGHWVHADAPTELLERLLASL